MLAVISLAGWYNRWNNSIATVTDRESVDWAEANLKDKGGEYQAVSLSSQDAIDAL